jgi:outer membrane protein
MKKNLVFVLVGMIMLSSLLQSQNLDRNMTLKDCITVALKNNATVLQAQNEILVRNSNVTAAVGSFLPNLNASAGWRESNRSGITTIDGIPIPIESNLTKTFSGSLSSSMTLFDGFANTSRLGSAKASADASQYNLERTKQGVIAQVYSYYFNVLRTEKIYLQRQEVVEYSSQQLDKLVESEKLGAVSQANVYQQQAQLASDELSLIQAESDFDKAKADMIAFLAYDSYQIFEFHDSSVKSEIDSLDYIKLKREIEDYNKLFDKAITSRPDYQSRMKAVNAADYNLTATWGGHLPSLSASASYDLNASNLNNITDNKTLSYGLSLSIPIFSRFQVSNSVQGAEVTLKNAEITRDEAKRTIQVEIRKALLDLDAAYKSYISAKRNVNFQKENVRIIQEKHNLGSSTLLDLLYATNNYNQSEVSMINATYTYLFAVKQIEYVLGILSE